MYKCCICGATCTSSQCGLILASHLAGHIHSHFNMQFLSSLFIQPAREARGPGRNSETKNCTIDPKVPKRNQRRGLRVPLCQKTGSHTKKINFGPKTGFLGPKKRALFSANHVPATTGQSCQKKKVPFSQMNISLLANFGIFFGKKRIFGPFSAFRQNVKTAVSP